MEYKQNRQKDIKEYQNIIADNKRDEIFVRWIVGLHNIEEHYEEYMDEIDYWSVQKCEPDCCLCTGSKYPKYFSRCWKCDLHKPVMYSCCGDIEVGHLCSGCFNTFKELFDPR